PPLADRPSIMESWRGILSNSDSPRIVCYDERVFLYGDTALVICEEELGGGTLIASNLFVRETGGWRIAHHQAGQLAVRRPPRPRVRRRRPLGRAVAPDWQEARARARSRRGQGAPNQTIRRGRSSVRGRCRNGRRSGKAGSASATGYRGTTPRRSPSAVREKDD